MVTDLEDIRPGVVDLTLDDLQAGLNGRRFTSSHLVETYLKRIEEVNSNVRAVVEVDPTAMEQASVLDDEREAGKLRSPLQGVPVLLKNQISTVNLENTSGSTALLGTKPGKDAPVVTKLREAGVITLGTSNMTQWGNSRDPGAGDGWSAHGGQVKGVYFEKQNPSGSSSGSCVGTALGLAFAGLGTEVEGSITYAAERSNLYGLKPTAGLVSRELVMDAASLLSVMAGKSPGDAGTNAIPFDSIPDYVKFCIADGLRGARIGVPRNALKGNPPCAELTKPVSDAFESHLEVLRECGAVLQNDTPFESFDETLTSKCPAVVKSADFKANLANYLALLPTNPLNIHNIDDVIRHTQADSREEFPARGTKGLEAAANALDDRESDEFKSALAYMEWLAHEGGVGGTLKTYRLDALVLPTCVSPIVPAIGGYPIISVPLGFYPEGSDLKWNSRGELITDGPGCPYDISFIGDLFSEEKLIMYAYAFEQHTQVGKAHKPIIMPKTELIWKTCAPVSSGSENKLPQKANLGCGSSD